MKQIIIMSAMIMLGLFIYNLIAGDGADSMINSFGRFWTEEIGARGGMH